MEGLGRKLAIEAQYLSIKRHMGRRVAAQSPFFSFSRTFQICLTRQKEKWQHGSTQVFKTTFILTWCFFIYYLLSELYSELEAFNQLHKFKKLTQNMWRWGGGVVLRCCLLRAATFRIIEIPCVSPVLLKSQNHTAGSPVMILLFFFVLCDHLVDQLNKQL